MANQNPISTHSESNYPDFVIPAAQQDKALFLTTETKVSTEGWKLFGLTHVLSIDGDPQDFPPNSDLVKQRLGICRDLDKIRMSLKTTPVVIHDGGAEPNTAVEYRITFEVDDEKLESFTSSAETADMVSFYTKITFKTLS